MVGVYGRFVRGDHNLGRRSECFGKYSKQRVGVLELPRDRAVCHTAVVCYRAPVTRTHWITPTVDAAGCRGYHTPLSRFFSAEM